MILGDRVLAVIPARGGSRRVLGKNLREYQGVPLVLRAWAEALKSRYIDVLVVSTEDSEIKQLCEKHLVFVVDRPSHLATDEARSEDVLRHALYLSPAEWVVMLQPTSPLRTAQDIDSCIEIAKMDHGCISYNRDTARKNGAVYVAGSKWIAKHDFSHTGLMRYLMPASRSLDIDTEADFA